jgi:hypothetical protein
MAVRIFSAVGTPFSVLPHIPLNQNLSEQYLSAVM